ncbi:alpha/beta hydrolase [Pelomonas sp. KK5]|uniref:alpha/beta hydrolase n=1 Tax=Pelomonas sp. KK5 TaxID=1855730 RepID=UPI00097C86C3|nr:alpha/beta hydrolase [Pelomonas sp. KK5]
MTERYVFKTVPATPMDLPAPIALGDAPAFQWTGLARERILRNVSAPLLYPVLPPAGKGNGRALLVVPGGGYKFVAVENEGWPVAQRLAEAGWTVFVLVYRVNPTPPADEDFAASVNEEIAQRFASATPRRGNNLQLFEPAVEDARLAMAWVKAHAADYGCDPARSGYLGFSAGAHSGRALAERAAAGEMPATLALIYGGFGAFRAQAPVPPLFVAQALDDPLFPPDDFGIVQAWREAGQRVELHLYERGSHGFGLIPRGTTSDQWLDAYLNWLDKQ